jgi:hypothetical protein
MKIYSSKKISTTKNSLVLKFNPLNAEFNWHEASSAAAATKNSREILCRIERALYDILNIQSEIREEILKK